MTDQEGTRGPEPDGSTRGPILEPDPLVEKLLPDPSRPPTPTVVLAGLLGRSPKEGNWRLYFSTALNRYAEFEEKAVLHSENIPGKHSPFAGSEATRVWLKGEAEVEYTLTELRRVRAEALQGVLAARATVDDVAVDVLRALQEGTDLWW